MEHGRPLFPASAAAGASGLRPDAVSHPRCRDEKLTVFLSHLPKLVSETAFSLPYRPAYDIHAHPPHRTR